MARTAASDNQTEEWRKQTIDRDAFTFLEEVSRRISVPLSFPAASHEGETWEKWMQRKK